MKQLQNISVARVSTVPFYILTQLDEQISAIIDSGAEVSVVSSEKKIDDNFDLTGNYEFIAIYIPREISISKDLLALFKLWKLFRVRKFNIVHSTTPKAGFLCAVAARLANIPIRLHTYTGQTWVTLKGIKKRVVKICDKVIGIVNTRCYTDSFSQQRYLVENKVIGKKNLFVLGNGSLAGVNIQRFSKERFPAGELAEFKAHLNINKNEKIILYVGRITREKGIYELIDAFEVLLKKQPEATLVLVGPIEADMGPEFEPSVKKRCTNKVLFTGFSIEPERYMAIADIFCLPSYREGFGTVVIEAGSMGLPVIGTKIYGLTDAIIDGETGILVTPQNSLELVTALERLINDDELRFKMGENAKARARNDFDSKVCNQLLITEYQNLIFNYGLNK